MSRKYTIAIVCLVLVTNFAVQAQDASSPVNIEWQRRTDMPKAVGGPALGILGGAVIVAGGTAWLDETQKAWLPDAYAYDSSANKWNTIPAMPRTAGYPCAVSFRDTLYVFGGQTAKEVNSAESLRLVRSEGSFKWEPFVALPERLANMQAALVNSTAFLVAGDSGDGTPAPNNHVWKIDLAAENPEWKNCAPLPGQNRTGVATAACGGKVFSFGGDIVSAYCYDPALDRWDPLPDSALSNVLGVGGFLQDRFIVMPGGFVSKEKAGLATPKLHMDANGFVSDVLVYDTVTSQYSFSNPLPKGIIDYGLARIDNRIYLAGGEDLQKHRESWLMMGVMSLHK